MRHPVLFCLAAACGPAHLGGVIDGEHVGGARDAFYDTVNVDLGPLSYEALLVILTDFPDGCEVYEEFAETFEPGCEERCEAYLEIADTHGLHADQFWLTSFYVNTSDGIDGEFELNPGVGEGEFIMSFQSFDGEPLRDQAACEEACEDGDLLADESEDGEDGELSLEAHDNIIKGRFDVGFGGDEGASGSFAARPCDIAVSIDIF